MFQNKWKNKSVTKSQDNNAEKCHAKRAKMSQDRSAVKCPVKHANRSPSKNVKNKRGKSASRFQGKNAEKNQSKNVKRYHVNNVHQFTNVKFANNLNMGDKGLKEDIFANTSFECIIQVMIFIFCLELKL